MKRLAFLVLTVLALVPVWAAGPRAIYVKEAEDIINTPLALPVT